MMHPEKYVGDVNNIICRSSWEKKFILWADTNPSVLKICSEEIVVPYWSQVDQKMRRYFPDFAIQVKTRTGEVKKYLVEIKPSHQTIPPKGTRKTKRLLEETATYVVNMDKWKAADEWARKNGFDQFMVITEDHLFPKKNGNKT
jgi:hypothetical protein